MIEDKMSKANLCAIYRSSRKEGMFLYVAKRDQFDAVPEVLMQQFGKPQFVMFLQAKSLSSGRKTKTFYKLLNNKVFIYKCHHRQRIY